MGADLLVGILPVAVSMTIVSSFGTFEAVASSAPFSPSEAGTGVAAATLGHHTAINGSVSSVQPLLRPSEFEGVHGGGRPVDPAGGDMWLVAVSRSLRERETCMAAGQALGVFAADAQARFDADALARGTPPLRVGCTGTQRSWRSPHCVSEVRRLLVGRSINTKISSC